jgi:glycosyltransferase involved in cell wall biosynthesis
MTWMHEAGMRLAVVIPVFNDWEALTLLLQKLDDSLAARGMRASAIVVDDGSTSRPLQDLVRGAPRALVEVEILHLARNLGHQRAIAIGLTFVHQERSCDAVVVMDGDGEDRPDDVPRLVDELLASQCEEVVFAARVRRTEGVLFRVFYALYRVAHRLLTGVAVKVGNFSVLPHRHLSTFVVVSEAWNHYAAAIFHARIPYRLVPTVRGHRLSGRSTMNFVSLVTHGLSAIAVFGDIAGVRILLGSSGLFGSVLALLLVTVLIRLCTNLAIPGWATYSSGLLVVISSQILTVAFVVAFFILSSRNNLSFVPLRDYKLFVKTLDRVYPAARGAERDG